jgi:hypothetical protein
MAMLQLVMLWILAFGIYVSLIMMLGRPKGGSATPLTGPRWALADLDFAHFPESYAFASLDCA